MAAGVSPFLVAAFLPGEEEALAAQDADDFRSRKDWDNFLADLHLRWGGQWANPGKPQ